MKVVIFKGKKKLFVVVDEDVDMDDDVENSIFFKEKKLKKRKVDELVEVSSYIFDFCYDICLYVF